MTDDYVVHPYRLVLASVKSCNYCNTEFGPIKIVAAPYDQYIGVACCEKCVPDGVKDIEKYCTENWIYELDQEFIERLNKHNIENNFVVLRTSGQYESGWKILVMSSTIKFNNKLKIRMTFSNKTDNYRTLEKSVFLDDLCEWNKLNYDVIYKLITNQ